MLNRFFRLLGCTEDHALECDSTTTTNLIPVKKQRSAVEWDSAAVYATIEAPKENTNIISFVTSLNSSGYEVVKSRSKSILIKQALTVYGAIVEPGTPIPKIIFEEDEDLSPANKNFDACEGAAMSSPIQTIRWGKDEFFYFDKTDNDKSKSAEVTDCMSPPRP